MQTTDHLTADALAANPDQTLARAQEATPGLQVNASVRAGVSTTASAVSTSLFESVAHHTPEWTIHWLFRLALCCEFIGHGAFGVLTKQAWVPYFGLCGIPEAWAWTLMPVVGSVDIALGTLTLLAPRRIYLVYMACWALLPALLRPLAGEG